MGVLLEVCHRRVDHGPFECGELIHDALRVGGLQTWANFGPRDGIFIHSIQFPVDF